jgi:hypothetical protein
MNINDMYTSLPNLVLGFHGCPKKTADNVLYNNQALKPSINPWDWLGNGVYFWENSYDRAYEWAVTHSKEEPAVIGAVIDLGYCLNLLDYGCNELLKIGYEAVKTNSIAAGTSIPINRDIKGNDDKLIRNLDCAVIEAIHTYVSKMKVNKFDSVRGVFIEGKPVYEGSGFYEKSHIQLCIRNMNCIKGYFNPLGLDLNYQIP